MEEIWKDIKGFEGKYQISTIGRVKSINCRNTGKTILLKQVVTRLGYKLVRLYKNGIQYNKSVHRLVAEAFLPNPHNKPEVDHINCERADNRVENLRWCTHKENCNNQLTIECFSNVKKGVSHPYNWKKICQYTKDGKFIREWVSIMSAAKELKLKKQNISSCCKKRAITAGGYIWRYKEEAV